MTTSQDLPHVFFAYGSESTLRAETMRLAAAATTKRGLETRTWEDLTIAGRAMIPSILQQIDSSTSVVAEISDMNSNVLFEAGYAIARNKLVIFALDETDSEATKRWNAVGILSNIGRVDYGGNSEILANQVAQTLAEGGEPELLSTLLANGPAPDGFAIFAPVPPTRYQAVDSLNKWLDGRSDTRVLAANEELGIAPLDYYVKEIFRASGALVHLVGPQRINALDHNARASLLAGIATGLDTPTLIVAETSFSPPLDYRDLLYRYGTAQSRIEKVDSWLKGLAPALPRPAMRLPEIRMPVQTFGQYVAENEREELSRYYVATSELHAVISGTVKLFVGRKGTGKTATMNQAVEQLRLRQQCLVARI